MNDELRAIYEADQADRASNRMADGAGARDRDRRRRVAQLLAAGEVVDGRDHFHAAMVFQHGGTLRSYRLARELALRAVELGHRPGRWLAAAALDRLLVHQGRPQKYGTQYWMPAGELVFIEVDPETTDSERADWDVRTDVPDQLPWLPDGVTPARRGDGGSAVGPDGWSVSWTLRPMSADEPVVVGWNDDRGEPRPELIEVAGGPAVLIEGDGAGTRWLIRPVSDGQGFVLLGTLPRDDLLRVAASLPGL